MLDWVFPYVRLHIFYVRFKNPYLPHAQVGILILFRQFSNDFRSDFAI